MTNYKDARLLSENHRCADCDLGDEMVAEIEHMRLALQRIVPVQCLPLVAKAIAILTAATSTTPLRWASRLPHAGTTIITAQS